MNNRNAQSLIDGLVADLQPVKPIRAGLGWLLLGAALVATVAAVFLIWGPSSAVIAPPVSAIYAVVQGLLLVLGLASASAAIAMASPRVGSRYDGPKWAAAMAATLPISAIILLVTDPLSAAAMHPATEIHCAAWSMVSSVVVAGTLVRWLRRGAPASLTRAGYLVGVASGALGTFAYGIACPIHTIEHLGIWHFLPIGAAAMLGRFVVPPMLRW